jgi:hypothetical protein
MLKLESSRYVVVLSVIDCTRKGGVHTTQVATKCSTIRGNSIRVGPRYVGVT